MGVRVYMVKDAIVPDLPEQETITAKEVLEAAGVEFDPETQILINENDGAIELSQEIKDNDRIFVVPKDEYDEEEDDEDEGQDEAEGESGEAGDTGEEDEATEPAEEKPEGADATPPADPEPTA